jgi:ribosomal protein L32E
MMEIGCRESELSLLPISTISAHSANAQPSTKEEKTSNFWRKKKGLSPENRPSYSISSSTKSAGYVYETKCFFAMPFEFVVRM